jgi:hypothetical protein
MEDRKQEHKQNVIKKLAGAKTPAERARVVLQGTIDALTAKATRQHADNMEEIAFMQANLDQMVAGIEHGVK